MLFMKVDKWFFTVFNIITFAVQPIEVTRRPFVLALHPYDLAMYFKILTPRKMLLDYQ